MMGLDSSSHPGNLLNSYPKEKVLPFLRFNLMISVSISRRQVREKSGKMKFEGKWPPS